MIQTTTTRIEHISNEELDILDNIPTRNQDYNKPSGEEHYRLLRFIASRFYCAIDIGTYRGYSALALSGAEKVTTFDIENNIKVKFPKNVNFIIGNAIGFWLKRSDFILLDVDHSGDFEAKVHQYLCQQNWQGIMMADDIHYNDNMEYWWNDISNEKYDITHIGHWSGTGLIYYG